MLLEEEDLFVAEEGEVVGRVASAAVEGCREVEVGSRSSKESGRIRSAAEEEEVVAAAGDIEVDEEEVAVGDGMKEEIEDLLKEEVGDSLAVVAGTTTEDREEEANSTALDVAAAAADQEPAKTSSD